MRIGVLGIDAAWSPQNRSGICLLGASKQGWECVQVSSSVRDFVSPCPKGEAIEPASLLNSCRLLGIDVQVVAIDLPLSRMRIIGRRESDNAVSREFGKFKASTHSPSAQLPGNYSDSMRRKFEAAGFGLAVRGARFNRSLIEVYPHIAILSLMPELEERLRYKVSKTNKYWPGKSIEKRKKLLEVEHDRLLAALSSVIQQIEPCLPEADSSSLAGLKPYEDALDSIVCAWVGAKFLDGLIQPYGDDVSTIWNPAK